MMLLTSTQEIVHKVTSITGFATDSFRQTKGFFCSVEKISNEIHICPQSHYSCSSHSIVPSPPLSVSIACCHIAGDKSWHNVHRLVVGGGGGGRLLSARGSKETRAGCKKIYFWKNKQKHFFCLFL